MYSGWRCQGIYKNCSNPQAEDPISSFLFFFFFPPVIAIVQNISKFLKQALIMTNRNTSGNTAEVKTLTPLYCKTRSGAAYSMCVDSPALKIQRGRKSLPNTGRAIFRAITES